MLGIQKPPTPPTIVVSDDETKEVNPKLVKVLKKLLQPKLRLHNDDYLSLLHTQLTSFEKSNCANKAQEAHANKQLLIVWLQGAVMQFERSKTPPNVNILVFTLNITKYLCECEQIFVKLNSEDIFERLIKIVKKVSHTNVTVSLIKLLSSFMEHKSGLQWIISTNHWELLVDLVTNNETIYISKEGYKFVAKLLTTSISFNKTFCKTVITHILSPLDNAMKIPENLWGQPDTRWLLNTLGMLKEVLTILSEGRTNQDQNSVIFLFLDNYELEKRIRKLLSLTKDPGIKSNLYKIMIFIGLNYLKLNISGMDTVSVSRLDSVTDVFYNTLYDACTEVSVMCMLQLLYTSLETWTAIKTKMPVCVNADQKVVTFEDQMLVLQFMPVFTILVKTVGTSKCDTQNVEGFRFQFLVNLIERVYQKTVRVKYKWLEHLKENFLFSNGTLALKFMVHSKHFYEKKNAILAFQMLNYFLEDLVEVIADKPEVQMILLSDPDFLPLHLNMMVIIIEDFSLTWKDTAETFFIIHSVYKLLNGVVWPTKVVVNALKLAEKGISKYMTFQMALLVDESNNCFVREFPPLLVAKLHDGAWEVRDSAVEFIRAISIAVNAIKFTSYKKCLLENDLPCIMVRMATEDGSPFVRASALKCLQEMIKDQEFWDIVTGTSINIFDTILKILQMETEGVVRSEAAILVDCIYANQKIPDELISKFYDVMSHAVIADLHWEVRVKALHFWKRVIDDHLTQQGMIDGSFPSVTFSKQHKKIVTLSPHEVRKRLITVLNELSVIGCLYVFYEALKDECDLEVSKFATETLSDFIGLLKEYEVSVESIEVVSPTTILSTPDIEKVINFNNFNPLNQELQRDINFSNMDLEINGGSEPFSEAIMDSILDTRDLNLLESVFNTLDTPVLENISVKPVRVMCPKEFLKFVYTDLEKQFDDKMKCIQEMDNFQSLLDDILKDYEPSNVNSMDCY